MTRAKRSTKKACLCLLLLHAALASAAQAENLDPLKDGVVQVQAGNKVGTGFILEISDRQVFVLSACHVVEGVDEIAVAFYREPQKTFPASVVKNEIDPMERGLTLLRVEVDDTRALVPLTLTRSVELSQQEPVFAIGFYGGGRVPWSVTESTVVGKAEGSLLFVGAIAEGNSGGPLIQDGQVIGVVTEKGPEHNYARSASDARRFTEEQVGVLPVVCNEPLIPRPKRPCTEQIPIDRLVCDYIAKGNALYKEGRHEEALSEYDKAIAYKGENAVLFNNRGVVRLTSQDGQGALEDFDQALKQAPDYLIAEVNQIWAKAVSSAFQGIESLLGEDTAPANPVSELLRGFLLPQEEVEGKAKPSLQGLLERLSPATLLGGFFINDAVRKDKLIELFDKGEMTCYGGDIMGLSDEPNTVFNKAMMDWAQEINNL